MISVSYIFENQTRVNTSVYLCDKTVSARFDNTSYGIKHGIQDITILVQVRKENSWINAFFQSFNLFVIARFKNAIFNSTAF